jgi:hypothetical protein
MGNPQDGVEFGTLTPDGVTNVRRISRETLLACPRVILVAGHYRDDGTCRCDVATVCPTCDGEGIEPRDEVLPCRTCDGVGLLNWSE